MFEITWFTIDLQTLQIRKNTFPNNYKCLCLKKEKGKERNDERRKGGKIEWNVPWSKTWVNLLVVELGQFDHSRSFLRIHNPREYRFFQLETPFLGTQRINLVPWMENTRLSANTRRERYFWRVTSCDTVEKNSPYSFFSTRKENSPRTYENEKMFFPHRILLKIVESNLIICMSRKRDLEFIARTKEEKYLCTIFLFFFKKFFHAEQKVFEWIEMEIKPVARNLILYNIIHENRKDFNKIR